MARTESLSSIAKKLDKVHSQKVELAKREARLKKQAAAARSRARAREREQRDHALRVMGGLVEYHILGGDWVSVDLDELDGKLAEAGESLGAACRSGASRTADEANAYVRNWESVRAAAKRAQAQAAKAASQESLSNSENSAQEED